MGRASTTTLGLLFAAILAAEERSVTIDASQDLGELPHFWAGTGLNYEPGLTGTDTGFALDHLTVPSLVSIGSIPFERTLMRAHFVDTMLVAPSRRAAPDGKGWDWREFDAFFDFVVRFNRMGVVYEFMGRPRCADGGEYESPDPQGFVRMVIGHLVERYGRGEVRQWFFQDANESWNEEWYDAIIAGGEDVDKELILGGEYIDLKHIRSGTNRFTGAKAPLRMDHNGFHVKGMAQEVVGKWSNHMLGPENVRDFPDAIWTDWETDSEWGWYEDHAKNLHRSTIFQSAWKAEMVHHMLEGIINARKVRFRCNFDDAFIADSWQNRCQTTNLDYGTVKRPGHNVLTMLALLGDRQIAVVEQRVGERGPAIPIIASRRGDEQVAILAYHPGGKPKGLEQPGALDALSPPGKARPLRIRVTGLPFAGGRIAHYRLDADHGDTFRLWRDGADLATLRRRQELTLAEPVRDCTGSSVELATALPPYAVSLFLISAKPEGPAQVQNLRHVRVPTHRNGEDDIYVVWDEVSRVIGTYEVEYASPDGSFERVNPDLLCTAYAQAVPGGAAARFRVRAVDYWGRKGPWSAEMAVPAADRPQRTGIPYAEDFSGRLPAFWHVVGGDWQARDGKLVGRGKPLDERQDIDSRVASLGITWIDHWLLAPHTDITVTVTAAPDADALIVYDFRDPWNYRFAGLLAGKWVLGERRSRIKKPAPLQVPAQLGGSHTLRLAIRDQRSILYVDGEELLDDRGGQLHNPQWPSWFPLYDQQVGLAVANGTATFDDLHIAPVDGTRSGQIFPPIPTVTKGQP